MAFGRKTALFIVASIAAAGVIFQLGHLWQRGSGKANITVNPAVRFQTWHYNMMLLAATPAWGDVEPSFHPEWNSDLKRNLLNQFVSQLGINTVQLTEPSGDLESRFYCKDPLLVACRSSWPVASLDYQYEKYILGTNGMAELLRRRNEKLHVIFQYIHWPKSPDFLVETPEYVGREVAAAFIHIRNKYGAEYVPDIVDLMVEPDGQCATTGPDPVPRNDCSGHGVWTWKSLGRAIASTAGWLRSAGFPLCTPAGDTAGCIQIWGPSTTWSVHAVDWYRELTQVAGPVFTALTSHWYDGGSDGWPAIRRTAADRKICPVLDELVPLGVDDLYQLISMDDVCGVEKYSGAVVGSSDNPSSYLTITTVDPYRSRYTGQVTGVHSPAWFFPQYMHYMRDGDIRVSAQSDNSQFKPVAFRSPSGIDKVIVLVRVAGDQTIYLKGIGPGTYGCTWTLDNSALLLPCGPDQTVGDEGSMTVHLRQIPTSSAGQTTAVVSIAGLKPRP